MSAASRVGGGKVASWFNGWWVVGLAFVLGVGVPLFMALGKARPAGVKSFAGFSWFSGAGEAQASPADAASAEQLALVRENEMSERMQQTVLLATAASVRLRDAQLHVGMPADTGALYLGMSRQMVGGRPLLPKSFSGPREGTTKDAVILSTEQGLFLLRYSGEGGGLVEVISVSKRSDGEQPAMMARLPDDKAVFGDGVGFYTRVELAPGTPGAKSGLDGMLEPAFADTSRLVGAGWRITKLSLPKAQ